MLDGDDDVFEMSPFVWLMLSHDVLDVVVILLLFERLDISDAVSVSSSSLGELGKRDGMGGAVLLLLSGGMDSPDVVTISFLDLGDLLGCGMLVIILDMIYSMGPDCMD